MENVRFARAAHELGRAAADGLPILAEALDVLDRHIGADALNVASVDVVRGTHGAIAIRGAPPVTEAEASEWLRLIPTHPHARWLLTSPRLTSRLTDVVSLKAFERTELYQTLFRPRGHRYQAAMLLDRRPDRMTVISLWRQPRDFTDREVEALELTRGVLVTGFEHHAALGRVRAWAGPGLDRTPLTPRQIEVTALVARGLTNAQIASLLRISPRTVRKHLEDVFAITGCRSRTAVARWWVEGGGRAT